jgi:hypothetical protein
MKQTAVEQLQIWLNSHLSHEQQMQFEGLFQQAKEMEKEQIIDAFNYAQIDLGMEADEYYEQIFKPYCMPEGLDTPEKHEQYLKDIGLNNK